MSLNCRHNCGLTNPFVSKEPQSNTPLPSLGLGSLLDLLQTGISVADPVPCLTDLRWIHRNSAGNFFASRHEGAFIFHRFCAFDAKFPMMPEFEESVIHGLGFRWADATATH